MSVNNSSEPFSISSKPKIEHCSGKDLLMKKFLKSNYFFNQEWKNMGNAHLEKPYDKCIESKQNVNVLGREELGEKSFQNEICLAPRITLKCAWDIWRDFTMTHFQRRREKTKYETKITVFLEKLQKSSMEQEEASHKNQNLTCLQWNNLQEPKAFRDLRNVKIDNILTMHKKKEDVRRNILHNIRISQEDTQRQLLAKQKENRNKIRNLNKSIREINVEERGHRCSRPVQDGLRKDSPMKVYPVPEFVKRMEKRKEERNSRWRDLKERKRKAAAQEESRQKQKEMEILEAEKVLSRNRRYELEEKKKLEKEIEQRKMREKEKMRGQWKLAVGHHENLLLGRTWARWVQVMRHREAQQYQADQFYLGRLKGKYLSQWKVELRKYSEAQVGRAMEFHGQLLQKVYFRLWMSKCVEVKNQFQVAVDWNDLKISEKFFRAWLAFTLDEQIKYLNLKEMANLNHERILKRKCMQKLKDYPKLIKAQFFLEQRKSFWRRKIHQILPDYDPIMASRHSTTASVSE